MLKWPGVIVCCSAGFWSLPPLSSALMCAGRI